MKKLLPVLLLLTTTCLFALAQPSSDVKISLGPEIGKPLGAGDPEYNVVYGASANLEIPFSPSGPNLTVTAGYEVFNISSQFAQYGAKNTKFIPVEIGLKAYLQNSPVFAEGDIGTSIFANSGYSTNRFGLLFSPALGVSLAQNAIDISARYEARMQNGYTLPFVALRIAYKFGLK